MFSLIWNKYLPLIRILLKRAAKDDQSFQINKSDFEKISSSRKSGISFSIVFKNGRPERTSHLPVAGRDLVTILMEDPLAKELFQSNEFHISLNKKMMLDIRTVRQNTEELKVEQLEQAQ